MRAPLRYACICSALLGALGSGPARAEDEQKPPVNRELSNTIVEYYLQNHKFSDAENYLSGHLNEDPSDTKAWRILGHLLTREKRLDEAQKAFAVAAQTSQGADKGAALYYLADVKARAGDVEGSQKALAEARDQPGFAAPVEAAEASIKSGSHLPDLNEGQIRESVALEHAKFGKHRFKISGSLRSGYDNNVLLLSDDAKAGQAPASTFINPAVVVDYGTSLFGGGFGAQFSGGGTFHMATAAHPFNNASGALATEWKPRKGTSLPFKWSIAAEGDLSYANIAGMKLFSDGITVGPNFTYSTGDNQELGLSIPFSYRTYPGAAAATAADVRDGPDLAPSLRFRHPVSSFSFSEMLLFDKQFARGANYKSTTISAFVGVIHELPWQVTANVGLGYSHSAYPSSTDGRADSHWNCALEFTRVLMPERGLSASLSYGYDSNNSKTASASYNKNTIALKIAADIL